MLSRKNVAFALMLLLGLAVMAQADSKLAMTGAEFAIGNDLIYIYGTTASADNEEALIPLSYRVYGELLPAGDIVTISLKISYDKSKLELYGDSSTYWPGNYTIDSVSAAPNVIIYLDAGSVAKDSVLTEFAYLKFRAKCQDGVTPSSIAVVEGLNNSYVLIGNPPTQVYDGEDGGDGAITIDAYEGYLSIIDSLPADSIPVKITLQGIVGTGAQVAVPVYLISNFNINRIWKTIEFDNTKLQIDSVILNDTVLQWITGDPIFDTNYVFLAVANYSNPLPPQSTPHLMATIFFTVINNWEGQSTEVEFGEIYPYPFHAGYRWGGECNSIITAIIASYYNGTVEIENYAAALKTVVGDMIWPADVTAGDADFPVTIQMKNNFIAGGGTVGQTTDDDARVRIDFSFTAAQNAQISDIYRPEGPDSLNPLNDFWFGIATTSAKGLAWDAEFYSVPTTDLNNKRGVSNVFTDLLNFNLEYDVVAPTSFDNRFIPISYLCSYDGLPARVMDQPTGTITTSCNNYLTFEPGSQVEYAVGEFYAPGVTVNGMVNPVYQHYYIRHNQDMVNFRVKIRKSGVHSMNLIVPAAGVEIAEQGSDYVILQSTANWDSTAVLTRTEIAYIKYTSFAFQDPEPFKIIGGGDLDGEKDNRPPIEYCYTTTNIYLENLLIEDTLDRQPTYFASAGQVRNKYICSIYEPRSIQDPGGIEDPWKTGNIPSEFALYNNRPNPFNPTTGIAFDMPVSGHVKIEVFNILGQKVATLVDETREAGHHEVIWNASNQSSGIFLYRMTTDGYQKTQKMLLMK